MLSVHDQIAQYDGLTADDVLSMASKLTLEKLQRGELLTSPTMVVDYLRNTISREPYETFHALYLDTRHRVIKAETVFTGTIDGAAVYPRVIVEKGLLCGAAALIVAHNHPSGIAEPSLADQAITRKIKEACALVEIRLLDHFVICQGGDYVSLASRGML